MADVNVELLIREQQMTRERDKVTRARGQIEEIKAEIKASIEVIERLEQEIREITDAAQNAQVEQIREAVDATGE